MRRSQETIRGSRRKGKDVLDFLPNHDTNSDVIVLGQCPSSKTTPSANGTFARLKKWMDYVGVEAWDFHNVIPHKINSYDLKDVDSSALMNAVKGKNTVISLGGFVERACKKHSIDTYKIDHPSPRNRNLNSKDYELAMLESLKQYLYDRNNTVL